MQGVHHFYVMAFITRYKYAYHHRYSDDDDAHIHTYLFSFPFFLLCFFFFKIEFFHAALHTHILHMGIIRCKISRSVLHCFCLVGQQPNLMML